MFTTLPPDYENYTTTSQNYDQTRIPIGVSTIIAELSRNAKPLSEQTILDAGCGTGNYMLQIHDEVRKIVGLDRNQEMLNCSETKLLQAGVENFELRQSNLPEIPYEDGTFDGIMANQMIHHLDNHGDYPVLREFSQNAFKALKPDGMLIFNTCSPQQVLESYWYIQFIKPAAERMAQKYIPIDRLQGLFEKIGFREVKQIVNFQDLFFGEDYYNLEGPLDASWRDGDSVWSLLTEKELDTALEEYSKAKDENRLEKILNRCEKRREEIGHSFFVCGMV